MSKKPVIKEADIQKYVKSHLELRGWLVIETHNSWYRPAQRGITDLIAIKHGFVVFVECKRPTYRPCPSDRQMTATERAETEFRQQVRNAGAKTLLIKDFDEAIEDIKRLDAMARQYKGRL